MASQHPLFYVLGSVLVYAVFEFFRRWDGPRRRSTRRERELRAEMEEKVRHHRETGEWRQ